MRHGGLRTDLRSELAGRPRDGLAHGTGAAPCEAPGANVTVYITHVVMKQYVGGTGRVNAQCGANNAAARHMGLDNIGLEVFV